MRYIAYRISRLSERTKGWLLIAGFIVVMGLMGHLDTVQP